MEELPPTKVTIDGGSQSLSIPMAPSAITSFFPMGSMRIPIVAISPDGKESRSAVLRFERATETSGNVSATPQPALTPPLSVQFPEEESPPHPAQAFACLRRKILLRSSSLSTPG